MDRIYALIGKAVVSTIVAVVILYGLYKVNKYKELPYIGKYFNSVTVNKATARQLGI